MDELDTPAPDAATPPESTAAERLTGQPPKPAKVPKATKPAKVPKATTAPVAAAEEGTEEAADIPVIRGPAERTYRVHCPKDRTMPIREVRALTAADAKEQYCGLLGIITPGHPLIATAVD